MNKLIFLDIDGVLIPFKEKAHISDMEIDKLFLLKKLIDDSHSFGAVITSDRRYSEIDMKHKRALEKLSVNTLDN